MKRAASASLQSWSSLWHPAYRRALVQLGVFAVVMGAIVYAENVALSEFSKSLVRSPRILGENAVLRHLSAIHVRLGIALPLLVLGLFTALRVVRIVVDVTTRRYTAVLTNRARNDLELATLDHLLRKDDTFFLSRPPAEILNRLSSDIGRIVERRTLILQRWQSIFLIIGNIYFFFREDWRLALAGVAICAIGAWTMHRLTAPVKEMDRSYMQHDDKVRSTFEDILRAAPEVQVADLRGAVEARFSVVQADRRGTFLRFTALNARVNTASSISYLLAFLSLMALPLYFFHKADATVELALVPVVLKALPDLFTQASQLVFQRLTLQMAETSCKRLLEYDAGDDDEPSAPAALPARARLALDAVTYRYRGGDGSLGGGVTAITTDFPVGYWTAIVGAAGSGKSTLLQLIVGRVRPQSGRVLFGDVPLAELSAQDRARVLTLMPQTAAILDSTIEANLDFGRGHPPPPIDESDLEVIEATGLAALCRNKALRMLPGDTAGRTLPRQMDQLRTAVRKALASEGIVVNCYEFGGRDPHDSVIERLADVRADRTKVFDLLLDPRKRASLDAFAASDVGRALSARLPAMLEETRALLALPTYTEYTKLAKSGLDERIWQKRVAILGMKASATRSRSELRDHVVVALTAKVVELGALPEVSDRNLFRSLLGESGIAIDVQGVHPFMTWLDNLIFGVVDVSNSRVESRIDQVVLEILTKLGLAGPLTSIGLGFSVGRNGGRLSGGQRQIVSLTRALLRRTPVLVLDEPTSALDPNSRSRVAALLARWAEDRVVVTVTHDPELAREAHEVRVLGAGRILAAGTFDELGSSSAAFREVLKLP